VRFYGWPVLNLVEILFVDSELRAAEIGVEQDLAARAGGIHRSRSLNQLGFSAAAQTHQRPRQGQHAAFYGRAAGARLGLDGA
jgi:hypothetical protein